MVELKLGGKKVGEMKYEIAVEEKNNPYLTY